MSKEAEMKDLLDYNSETGVITWKVRQANCVHVGDTAGYRRKDGYLHIGVRGRAYLAHRLAWFLYYGEWPPKDIDHVNGIKDDNRLCNLRLSSRAENMQNTGKTRNNTSGYKCVDFHKPTGRWRVRWGVNGKRIHIGYYDTPEEAYKVSCKFAAKNHKEFFHE